jgi:hypothetical protein
MCKEKFQENSQQQAYIIEHQSEKLEKRDEIKTLHMGMEKVV